MTLVVVLSMSALCALGGVDWDTEIVNYVLSNCCGVDERYEDIKYSKDGGTLILAAEQCKKLLSKNEESPMRFRYKNRMYTKAIKRSTFEELTSDLLQKTIDVVHHAMSISTAMSRRSGPATWRNGTCLWKCRRALPT